ncbi:MAG: n-acetylglutamate synthase [Flavobacteriales bacterium]|nr:n-acetylglutamate synthase [Flavobacteriales bacterium]
MIDYNDRRFVPRSNSANGVVSPEVVFHYKQTGNIVTCSYAGGRILSGQLIALVNGEGRLDMRYHQVNDRGELMSGVCRSTPEVLPDGRVRMYEEWRWTSGDGSSGNSVLEELP